MRRCSNRYMPLPGQHARGNVEADPSCAGQIDLRPGVQIGEIAFDFARPFDRIDIWAQLDEIAGDEAGGEPDVPQRLDQKPRRVAARSRAGRQGFFRSLNARLHPDDIADVFLQLRIQIDQEIDRRVRLARNLLQISRKQRPGLDGLKIRRKLGLQAIGILEWKTKGVRLDKEVKGVDDNHLGREIDFDFQFGRLLRKDVARQPIALRVLLPVHKMVRRANLERIAQDGRARMRRRAQANGLRAEVDRSVVFVVRDVV